MSLHEGLGTLLTLLSWIAVGLAVVTGVVAAARFRGTGAGLVIGGSIAAMALVHFLFRIYRTVAIRGHLEASDVPRFLGLRLLVDAFDVAALIALIVALFVYPSVLARSTR